MADNKGFKSARINATTQILEFMNMMDGIDNLDKLGYNATFYKNYLDSLSDAQFKTFMKRLRDEEWFNLNCEINSFEDKAPDLDRIKKIALKYNIPLEEYIAFPHKTHNSDEPAISRTPVPVIVSSIRVLQQCLDHKQSYSSDSDHQNILTGQVTGNSKSSTFSNMQSIAFTTSNQTDIVKELLGPRSDDEVSKAKMHAQIEETGEFDINAIPVRTKDKQALETTRVMLISAGLRVAFGSDKLTYILPTA